MKTLLLALTLFAATSPALASPRAGEPEVDGEVDVTLKNATYVKVQVNGEDFDAVEFEKDGRVAVIKGLSLSNEKNAVTLIPTDAGLAPVTLELAPKDFKKKRKGKALLMVATATVKFEKAAAPAPAPQPDKPTEPAPSPIPPQPEDDL
jgi:hypothetical protein